MKSIQEHIILDYDTCSFFIEYIDKHTASLKKGSNRYGQSGVTTPIEIKSIPKDFVNRLSIFNVSHVNFTEKMDQVNCLFGCKYVKGDSFEKHRDDNSSNYGSFDINRSKRFKTFIIQLSNTEDYKGGDFIVDSTTANRAQGNCICFDSNLLHEVTEVTNGERYSLVLWLEKQNFNIKHSVI